MSLEQEFGTNLQKEIEGAIINDFRPNADGSIPTFIVASQSRANTEYWTEMERETKPYRRLGGPSKALGEAKAAEISMRVFINTVLKGWSNVYLDGKLLPFSKENAALLFKRLPRLYDKLDAKSNDIETFQDEVLDAEAGN